MLKLFIYLMVLTAFLTSCVEESIIRPKELLCEGKLNPTGIATTVPHFSWKNEATANKSYQTSYQILVASSASQLEEGNADLWNSGKVKSSNSHLIEYEGQTLKSRDVAYWKIRVWDHSDTPSEWSQIQSFSVGLLNAEEWQADYIGMRSDNSDLLSPFIRKSFELDEPCEEMYLHVNSLGYHELYINGQKVGDAVLAPAESQFDKRSFSLSYDVSPYMQSGENTIVLWLGYGWYKHFRGKAHDGPLVKAQLEGLKNGTWETLLKTDDSWKISESEYSILDNNKFGGEILNLNKRIPGFADPDFDNNSWENAAKIEVPEHLVTPQVVELNRIQERINSKEITMPEDQVYLIDMGKNLTGTVSIRFPELPKGHEVTIQYADHLASKNSELYALQSNKPGYNVTDREQQIFNRQTDKYISSGEHGVFTNKFNYRAFRYIKISNMPGPLHKDSITAQLVHTDFRQSATFTSSDEMLNQIHDLFAYTLKCLTLGGKMVDCPHYERLGYGGDGNASTMTAQTLFDLSSLYTTWLTHWADCNKPDGDMPHTAPSYWSSGGGPYWCTFIIKATWETYLNYGDKRVLETFYPNMLNWLGYVKKYSPNILLEQWPATEDRNWYLGDWATPEGVDQTDPRSVGLVTNCAIVDSYDKMIRIAGVLNKNDDLEYFKKMKKELSEAVHDEYYNPESATYATGVQIDLAYPLLLDIVPDSLHDKVSASLYKETFENRDGHLATGLVGLPVLTQWVTANNASEMMYEMMTKKDYPGFGYMLENGATTTWEHWRGERSRIHNCYNAPGAWFYQSIGGIQPLEEYPGYRKFQLSPRPPKSLTWAKISKDTPYGTIKVDWNKEEGQMIIYVTVPVGSMAKLVLPEGTQNCQIDGQSMEPDEMGNIWIENGRYTVKYESL